MATVYFKKIQTCSVDVNVEDPIEAKKLVEEFIRYSSLDTLSDLSEGYLTDQSVKKFSARNI